jgi:hypothetical protein
MDDITSDAGGVCLSGGSGRITRKSSPASNMTAAIAIANIASTTSYGSSIAFEDFGLLRAEAIAFGYPCER